MSRGCRAESVTRSGVGCRGPDNGTTVRKYPEQATVTLWTRFRDSFQCAGSQVPLQLMIFSEGLSVHFILVSRALFPVKGGRPV